MSWNYDTKWDAVYDALEDAVAITWDECHKIYVLMDEDECAIMEGYDYDLTPVDDQDEAYNTLLAWYEQSCGLRFIEAIRTTESGDRNEGFTSLIPQFYEDDQDGAW